MSLHKIKSALLPLLLAVGIIVLAVILPGTAYGDAANEPAANTESKDNMPIRLIHVTSLVENCRAEVYLNDIPVCMLDYYTGAPESGEPAWQYAIEGENVLTMIIGPGPTPSTAKTEPREGEEKATPEMSALASLSYYEEGAWLSPGGGDVQVEIRWTGEKEDSLPLVLTASVDLSPGIDPWKWQSADVLTLDEATLASAYDAIEKIRDLNFKGEAEPIIEMARHHLRELYQGYPEWSEGSMELGMKEFVEADAKNPKMMLSREDYDLRLIASGRLLEAVDKSWQPIIRSENWASEYPIMIGRLDGEWHILRDKRSAP